VLLRWIVLGGGIHEGHHIGLEGDEKRGQLIGGFQLHVVDKLAKAGIENLDGRSVQACVGSTVIYGVLILLPTQVVGSGSYRRSLRCSAVFNESSVFFP
jgi:hypothetical protein